MGISQNNRGKYLFDKVMGLDEEEENKESRGAYLFNKVVGSDAPKEEEVRQSRGRDLFNKVTQQYAAPADSPDLQPEPEKDVGFLDVAKSVLGFGGNMIANPVEDIEETHGDAARRFAYTPHAQNVELEAIQELKNQKAARDALADQREAEAEAEYRQVGEEAAEQFRPLEASLGSFAKAGYAFGKGEVGKALGHGIGGLGWTVLDVMAMPWSIGTSATSAALRTVQGDTERNFFEELAATKPGFAEVVKASYGPGAEKMMEENKYLGNIAFIADLLTPGMPAAGATTKFGKVLNKVDSMLANSADDAMQMAVQKGFGYYRSGDDILRIAKKGDGGMATTTATVENMLDDAALAIAEGKGAKGWKRALKQQAKTEGLLRDKKVEELIKSKPLGALMKEFQEASSLGRHAMGAEGYSFAGREIGTKTSMKSSESLGKFFEKVNVPSLGRKLTATKMMSREINKTTAAIERRFGEDFTKRFAKTLNQNVEAKEYFTKIAENARKKAKDAGVKPNAKKAVFDALDDLTTRMEWFRYKRLGTNTDEMLKPGDERFADYLRHIDFDETDPLDRLAKQFSEEMKLQRQIEKKAGVGATLRWQLDDAVEKDVKNLLKLQIEGDRDGFGAVYKNVNEAWDEIQRKMGKVVDQYETPEHFAVSNVWRDLSLEGVKPFQNIQMGTDIFKGVSKRNYVPRTTRPGLVDDFNKIASELDTIATLTSGLRKEARGGGAKLGKDPLWEFNERVKNHIGVEPVEGKTSANSTFRMERTSGGHMYDTVEFDRQFESDLDSLIDNLKDVQSLDEMREAALKNLEGPPKGVARNNETYDVLVAKRKELAKKLEELKGKDGGVMFNKDLIDGLAGRGKKHAKAIETRRMADRIVKNDNLVVHKRDFGKLDKETGKFKYDGWFRGGKPKYSLYDAIPGLPERYKNYAVNPNVYGFMHSLEKTVTDSKAILAYESLHHALKPVLLTLPKTGIRNILDASLKNFVEFSPAQALHGSWLAMQVMNSQVALAKKMGTQIDMAPDGFLDNIFHKMGEAKRNMQVKMADMNKDSVIMLANGETTTIEQLAREAMDDMIFGARKTRMGVEASKKGFTEQLTGVNVGKLTPQEQSFGKVFGEKARDRLMANKPSRFARDFLSVGSNLSLKASAVGDDFARLSHWLTRRVVKGQSRNEASLAAHTSHWGSQGADDLFYGLASRMFKNDPKKAAQVAAFSQRGAEDLFTFWTFTRNNLPYWWKTMLKHPTAMSALPKYREKKQQEAGLVGYLPYEWFEKTPYQQSPFPENFALTRKGMPALEYRDVSNAMSMFPALGGFFQELGDNPLSQASPVLQSLFGGVQSGAVALSRHKDAFYGRESRGPSSVLESIFSNLLPPVQWAQRPMEALGMTDTDYYPDEGLGEALYQRTTNPFPKRKMSLSYQEGEIDRKLRRMEEEGKFGTPEYRKLANAWRMMQAFDPSEWR